MDNNVDLTTILKQALNSRNNPKDFKAIHIGKVINLNPLTVSIYEGKVQLKENVDMYISEFFRFRCNINKTSELTTQFENDITLSTQNCTSAEGVSEIHSFTPNLPCTMPSAIAYLSTAIQNTNNAIKRVNKELLELKCDLKIGDLVELGSLEQTDRFILLDKVLDDDYKFYGDE